MKKLMLAIFFENRQRIGEGVCEDFGRNFKVFKSPKNK